MKLKDLQQLIKFHCEHGCEEHNVVIELNQTSIGGVATTDIDQIYAGIDWDMGKIIITTKTPIIAKMKDRDIPVKIKKDPVFNKKYICSTCGFFISKDDNYCRHCGQKLGELNG